MDIKTGMETACQRKIKLPKVWKTNKKRPKIRLFYWKSSTFEWLCRECGKRWNNKKEFGWLTPGVVGLGEDKKTPNSYAK